MKSETSVVRISRALDERLTMLAAKTGRRKSYYATKAIASYLEDLEDYHLGLARLEEGKGKRRLTLAEVERRLGLDGGVHAGSRKGSEKARKRRPAARSKVPTNAD